MIKYFLSRNLIDSIGPGSYCLLGRESDDKTQCVITSMRSRVSCAHENCLGRVLSVDRRCRLAILTTRSTMFPSGDNRAGQLEASANALIVVYDRCELISFVRHSRQFSPSAAGADIEYLCRVVSLESRSGACPVPRDHDGDDDEFCCENEGKSSIISKFCQCSYLYQLMKFQVCSFKRNSASKNLSAMGLEFILAFLLIILLRSIFLMFGDFTFHKENLQSIIAVLVKLLQDLLTWLMGVPVGFKLNKPLSRVLGQFYMFHVTIWENYMMSLIYPTVLMLIRWIPWLTPLGICFFLCLFLDILTLFTVHMMCFYVYACKLYRLQVIIICSLYRLFHGQKWNPFRQRVDTGPPEIDRMFVSTLVLAICVFLLPTTAIYYFVFTTFNLLLFILQYFVCKTVETIIQLPVLEILKWLIGHPCHKRVIEIQRVNQTKNCLVLSLQLHKVSFSSLFPQKINQKFLFHRSRRLMDLLLCIIKGHIL